MLNINKASLLDTAKQIVTGDRNNTHGDFYEMHKHVSEVVNAYLGTKLEPADIVSIMQIIKMVREKHGSFNIDDYIDQLGYTSGKAECVLKFREEQNKNLPEFLQTGMGG